MDPTDGSYVADTAEQISNAPTAGEVLRAAADGLTDELRYPQKIELSAVSPGEYVGRIYTHDDDEYVPLYVAL